MNDAFNTAHGQPIAIPMFDPIVSRHVGAGSSNVLTLLHQINTEHIYESLFVGRRDLVFLDIGANIGLVSLYASDSCKRIIAVEPSPQTFDVLCAMIVKYPQIETVNAALTPKDGLCDFYENDINSTASSTVNTYGKKITVNGFKLSSLLRFLQLEHVDIVKVDAEGAEGESLNFTELELARTIVKTWYIETHNCPANTWEYKLGRLVSSLSSLGYYKQSINGMTLTASLP